MAIGTGLAASLGVAAESTYGTYVAPTRFYEFNKQDVKKVKNTVQGGGLAAGRFSQLGSRRVVASEAASGMFEVEVANKGMGLLLNHLMGGTVTPVVQGATAAYLQTHTVSDNVGKFLTVQAGVPSTNGTVNPYTYKGGKVLSAEFSCGVDEILTSTWDMDFQRATESDSLVAPSYTAALAPFHFAQMNVKLGTFGSEATVVGVRKATAKIERGQATDRFYAGATVAGTKAEPLMNDYIKIGGSFDIDLVNKADFVDRFASDASTSLILEWVGPLIASTFYQTFRVRVPMVFFDGDSPTNDGPGITTLSVPWVGQFDGTNSVATIEYMSIDTVL